MKQLIAACTLLGLFHFNAISASAAPCTLKVEKIYFHPEETEVMDRFFLPDEVETLAKKNWIPWNSKDLSKPDAVLSINTDTEASIIYDFFGFAKKITAILTTKENSYQFSAIGFEKMRKEYRYCAFDQHRLATRRAWEKLTRRVLRGMPYCNP